MMVVVVSIGFAMNIIFLTATIRSYYDYQCLCLFAVVLVLLVLLLLLSYSAD